MKKSKFRRVMTVFLVILGVLAVLFGCLSPLLFQRDERLSASAQGVPGPVSVTFYWNNSMIRSASMVDSEGVTVSFQNKVASSPNLIAGETYTVSFSYYSGSDNITKVICDNPFITIGVPRPNNNTFTFTYQVGGPAIRFGIITDNISYDDYTTIAYNTTNITEGVLYLETQDDIMPRLLYPSNNYELYVKPLQSGMTKILDVKAVLDTDRVFLDVTQVGNGLISDLNRQNATFKQTFSYGASSYSTSVAVDVLDISSWTEAAYDKGHSVGYQDGYDVGYDVGHEDGYNAGLNDNSQYQAGYNEGYTVGLRAGQNISWGNLNVVSLFLSPVNSFLSTPLFGSFSIGSAFSVVLVVLLAAIFIKMFAGG